MNLLKQLLYIVLVFKIGFTPCCSFCSREMPTVPLVDHFYACSLYNSLKLSLENVTVYPDWASLHLQLKTQVDSVRSIFNETGITTAWKAKKGTFGNIASAVIEVILDNGETYRCNVVSGMAPYEQKSSLETKMSYFTTITKADLGYMNFMNTYNVAEMREAFVASEGFSSKLKFYPHTEAQIVYQFFERQYEDILGLLPVHNNIVAIVLHIHTELDPCEQCIHLLSNLSTFMNTNHCNPTSSNLAQSRHHSIVDKAKFFVVVSSSRPYPPLKGYTPKDRSNTIDSDHTCMFCRIKDMLFSKSVLLSTKTSTKRASSSLSGDDSEEEEKGSSPSSSSGSGRTFASNFIPKTIGEIEELLRQGKIMQRDVPGDGECGYHALDPDPERAQHNKWTKWEEGKQSRKYVAGKLLENIKDAGVRKLIAPEIEGFLQTRSETVIKGIFGENFLNTWKKVQTVQQRAEESLQKAIEECRQAVKTEIKPLNIKEEELTKDCILSLAETQHPELKKMEKFQKMKNEIDNNEKRAWLAPLYSEDTVRTYLANVIQNGNMELVCSQEAGSTGVADAFAKVENRNLVIINENTSEVLRAMDNQATDTIVIFMSQGRGFDSVGHFKKGILKE